jgi:hypothetical protein
MWLRKGERDGEINVAMKQCSGPNLAMAIGLLWLTSVWGAPSPPGSGGDRPDTKFRKGIVPRNPPPGYYDSASEPLRRQVLGGLTSALHKIASLWRK